MPYVNDTIRSTARGSTASRRASSVHIAELDGFRALAVWMVLLGHISYALPGGKTLMAASPAPVFAVVSRGWLGVDLFFVLSGFLITGILLDTKESAHFFRNFYGRRVLRILPLYFTVTTVLWLIYPACTRYFISCYAFAANFAAWFHLQGPAAGGAFWSLAVEEHFYLLWPLLVFLLPRKTLTALAIAIVIVTPAARALMASTGVDVEKTIYVWSWFRFDTLALGALLAVWVRSDESRRRHPLFMPGLLLGLALALTVCGIPIGILRTHSLASASLRYTQMGFLFAGLVSAALALRGSWLTAPLRSRFARVSSDYSYCMYLIHMGIGYAVIRLSLSAGWNTEHFGPRGLIIRSALIILVTFACAALSKRYLEDPMLRLKQYFPYSVSEPTAKSIPQRR